MKDINQITTAIKNLQAKKSNILIAIDGRSGSGKSTLAQKIAQNFEQSQIILLDSFDLYSGQKALKTVITEVLKPLTKKEIVGIVIVEGVFSLSEELREYYDLSIWVECPPKIGFKRGLERDIALNGINNSQKWREYWMPKEKSYIQEQKPQKFADLTIQCG